MKGTGTIAALLGKVPLFWRFQILGWATYALLTLPLKALLFESIGYALLVTLFRESFGLGLTTGFRSLYRRLGLRTARPVILILSVLTISFAGSALDLLLGYGIGHLGGRHVEGDPTFGIFCFRALLFTVWSLLYFALKDLMEARRRLAGLRKVELAARDAEILMLRAQVSPHFLFNAFNTILADLDGRNPELVPVVRGLSDYFRYSLASHDEVFVTMGEEYDAILSYLTVEKARFQDSLEIKCEMDPSAREMPVPGIFLQPLVENALKFGHLTSPTPLQLRLHVMSTAEGGLTVEVMNSGKWVEEAPERIRNDPGGNGLSVLRRRLELLYPGTHSLEVVPSDADVTIRIRLQLVRKPSDDHAP